ncbi:MULTISPECIES: cation diffusion facilitator family transporter [Nitrospirillum]|uniref:Protein p34 n=1 Tax=Nitrospirillum amazonense TaxID=28077 RepID=A0A560FRP7_9PROT|nr:cation diffusion facilitator family transporter [Nitrospirillum amazonense]MEC4593732.1 cation diffusion facilitator family transporter [Nitrospirillum amazonense]TWB24305.1 ferrous-iron efflux pump FieF [Nitrospirillum amazonense]
MNVTAKVQAESPDGAGEGDADGRWRRGATYASVTVAAILIAGKFGAYLATNSVSILSSLIDSSVDALASVITLISVARALKPPDSAFRFGHGKAEPLAALFQSAFIVGSALFLGYESLSRLFEPRPVGDISVGLWVMAAAIALTFVLVLFQRWVIRRTASLAIGADSLHYSGDMLLNAAVMVSLLLGRWTGQAFWDPLFGLGIAAFLVWGAVGISRTALDVLMDRELPDVDRTRVADLVNAHPASRGLHDLRTRSTGLGQHIEFHLELDSHLTLTEAHDITDEIESSLRAAFPNAEVTIHQEPAGLDDERLDHRLRPRRR